MTPYGGMGYGPKCGKWVVIKGKMWRVVRSLYANNRSCIFLEGKSSEFFPINQGVAHGCTLSLTLFLIYINGFLCDIKKCAEICRC